MDNPASHIHVHVYFIHSYKNSGRQRLGADSNLCDSKCTNQKVVVVAIG